MKALHLLDSLNRGGAETLALDLMRNASDANLDVTVVAAGGGALESEFARAGNRFIRLERRYPIDLRLSLQIRKIIKDNKIDVVHGHQAVDGVHLYLATLGLKHVRRVLSFHGFVGDTKNRQTLRFLIPRMDANVVVSVGLKDWLADKDGLRTDGFRVIYNGADPGRLCVSGKSLQSELGLDSSSMLIGMIANFYRDPRKDQMTLCKALPAILAELPMTHCVFAGKVEVGAEQKFQTCVEFCYQNGIADRVHFLGQIDDVANILACLDLFVLSSLQEGLPIVVLEAMLVGVPMVLSDIPPLLEASQNGEYAEVFPVGNESILTEKIIRQLHSRDARNDLSRRAQEFANRNFSIGSHTRSLRGLYESLLND